LEGLHFSFGLYVDPLQKAMDPALHILLIEGQFTLGAFGSFGYVVAERIRLTYTNSGRADERT
jgi:hypothetical protein